MSDIAENLRQVYQQIKQAAAAAERPEDSVRLLAVSKTKAAQAIREAHACGQRDFGENYLQEAIAKIEQLQDLDLCWHFIGSLQSNKTRQVAEHFAWLHTLERLKIAERLSQQRPAQLPPLQVCIQVNIDEQASKSGCGADEASGLAQKVARLPRLKLRGLMAIPAAGNGATAFAQLRDLKMQIAREHDLDLDTLSMGMSADMNQAIAAGASIVRVGSAIFGKRGN